MDGRHTTSCHDCVSSIVCRCLQVTEGHLVQAITRLALTTVDEVRQYTSAGEGCTCCHAKIEEYLREHGYERQWDLANVDNPVATTSFVNNS
jgi:NAD(P)H-nitrite reductase large subunit